MIEIGVFHNGASDLPITVTSNGVSINDGNLAEVGEDFGELHAALAARVELEGAAEDLFGVAFW